MTKEKRTHLAIQLARKASDYLLAHIKKVRMGTIKADGSVVSSVDKGAEKFILSRIHSLFPEDGILSEEAGIKKAHNDYQWIIDPLDGTHNFLVGLPLFGSLLALAYKGQVITGICAFPALNEFFIAQKGKGATLNGKPIHVSGAKTFTRELFLSDGNMRKAKDPVLDDIAAFTKAGCRLRILGSTAFSMTRVAAGHALIATNRAGTPWDIAAPALLVEEAGGKVSEPSGKPWRIHSKQLLATNGIMHKKALQLVKD